MLAMITQPLTDAARLSVKQQPLFKTANFLPKINQNLSISELGKKD